MDLQGEPTWIERLWEQAAFYEFFADRYGWTPGEVDQQRALLVELFPKIHDVRMEIKADRERRANA